MIDTRSVQRISSGREALRLCLAALVMICVACGGSSATNVDAAETAVPSTSPTAETTSTTSSEQTTTSAVRATTTTAAVAIDLDEWAAQTTSALGSLHDARFEAFLDYLETEDGEAPGYDDQIEILRAEAPIFVEFAEAMKPLPVGTELEPSATAFLEATDVFADMSANLADQLDRDVGEREQFEYDVSQGPETESFNALLKPLQAQSDQFNLTCFALQEDLTALSLPLLDCADSEQDDPIIGDDGKGNVQDGVGDLSAGQTYEFAEFTRPVTIMPDVVLTSEASQDLIYLYIPSQNGPPGPQVFFLGTDEILDPTAPRSPGPVEAFVPMPEDFGNWLETSGLTVNAEGTSPAGDLDVPWWEFEQVPAGTPTDPFSFALTANRNANGGNLQVFGSPTIVWQIDHPAGPLLVITDPFWEGQSSTRDVSFAFVESLLKTLSIDDQF